MEASDVIPLLVAKRASPDNGKGSLFIHSEVEGGVYVHGGGIDR